MNKRTQWRLLALLLVILLPCGFLLSAAETFLLSFPDSLLGQVYLSREARPVSGRSYQSAELVLGEVPLSEVRQGFYIHTGEDVLFWDPHYVGFARTALDKQEIETLYSGLVLGRLFYRAADGSSYECVVREEELPARLEPCADGPGLMDQYSWAVWEASQYKSIGVLQFHLADGQLVEIRVYQTESLLAYKPFEKSGDWWLNGIGDAQPLLDELQARAAVPAIPVLWPHLSAEQANARTERILGKHFQAALELVMDSAAVRENFGEIQEIRPAVGSNSYTSWMDSTSVFLTLRVTGTRGDGAVIIQGYECFDLQMVIDGVPHDDGNSYLCP